MNFLTRSFVARNYPNVHRITSSLGAYAVSLPTHQNGWHLPRQYTTLSANIVDTSLCHGKKLLFQHASIRCKSKRANRNQNEQDVDSDGESDNDDEDFREGNKGDKQIKKLKVNSMRLDTIVSTGFKISKNQVEKLFYESKLRINGRKMKKKSQMISDLATVDLVKGTSKDNANMLTVDRIEILSKSFDEEKSIMTLTVRLNKNLTIENYVDE